MRKFSSRLIMDLYTDSITGGYLEMLETLLNILETCHGIMTYDDYYYVMEKLCFCYYYSEWDSQKQTSVPYRDNYLDVWDKVVAIMDTREDVWNYLLTCSDRPDSMRYFGNKLELETLCRITR